MIFAIQGAWIDCARRKVLGIYSDVVIIIRAQRSCFTNGSSISISKHRVTSLGRTVDIRFYRCSRRIPGFGSRWCRHRNCHICCRYFKYDASRRHSVGVCCWL